MHGLFYMCHDCGGNGVHKSRLFPKRLAPGGNCSASGEGALTSVHSLSVCTGSENIQHDRKEAFLVSKELKVLN